MSFRGVAYNAPGAYLPLGRVYVCVSLISRLRRHENVVVLLLLLLLYLKKLIAAMSDFKTANETEAAHADFFRTCYVRRVDVEIIFIPST